MWNKGWDNVFTGKEWGKYPPEELIRFIARNFYNNPARESIKILEVGSGTGANIIFLAREGFHVTGIDGSEVGVQRTKERLLNEHLEATLFAGDIVNLPFENGSFDCVIDNECVYANSFEDSLKIINEVHRVLKTKGKFYSKTFMTGTYGDGNGLKLANENNTYTELKEGAFNKGYGIIRFTSEEEISDLYGSKMEIESIDHSIRSEKNRSYEIKEWVIICRKKEVSFE